VRTSGSESATRVIAASVERGQAERLLGELCGGGGCAALCRKNRGILEHDGNGWVRSVAREREVTRAQERILCGLRYPTVDASSRLAEVAVENR
jgi:hypothetical protein